MPIASQTTAGGAVHITGTAWVSPPAGAYEAGPGIPPQPLNDTVFPRAADRDLGVQIAYIEELYARVYPQIDYYPLNKAVTGAAPTGIGLSGEAGASKFDALYGETVDPKMATWQQPHGSPTLKAANVDQFLIPVPINARFQRVNLEKEGKRYGFDKVRDALVIFPHSVAERLGLKPQAGDKLVWDGDEYTVLQHDRVGFWKNSNVRLYYVLNVEHRRHAS
jgi:hypothetical protein